MGQEIEKENVFRANERCRGLEGYGAQTMAVAQPRSVSLLSHVLSDGFAGK